MINLPNDDEVIVHYDWEDDNKDQEVLVNESPEEVEIKKEETKKTPKTKKPKKQSTAKSQKKKTAKTKKNSEDPIYNNTNQNYMILAAIAIIAIILVASFFAFRTEKETGQPIAANVNGEPITLSKLDKFYEISVPQAFRLQVTKEQFLDSTLIPQILLRQEASSQGFKIADEEIETSIRAFLIRNQLSREQYLERLSSANLTFEEIQDFYADQILIAKLLNQTAQGQVEVTPREIDQYYEENSDLFLPQPDQIRASHILLESEEEAFEALNLLKTGSNFEELAAEKSKDPSAELNQGNLGFFGRGVMVAEFEEAAFALEENQLSDPVETQFGYHIILRKSDKISLEEASPAILRALQSSKQEAVFITTVSQLRAKSEIEIYLGQEQLPVFQEIELTFEETGDELCSEDGKPIVRMFSTSTCPHCRWIEETFASVTSSYSQRNSIVAYHWQLDTGDNLLTEQVENSIPKSEFDIFAKYNPKSTVPTFVIGCKYARIGNAFEKQNNLPSESDQLKKVIEKII